MRLTGHRQAPANAVGAAATAEASVNRKVDHAGLWLAEQVLDPGAILSRLAVTGLAPVITER